MKYKDKIEKDSRITILALSWRDLKSPTAGGAEVHTHEMLKRADRQKFRIIHFAALYEGGRPSEFIDNIHYIRKGSIISVIWYAFCYYIRNRKNIDFVIEQCNTHRFFTPIWVKRRKRIFYIHQLTREIWDINLKKPFNIMGRVLENSMLRLNKNDYTIALSPSTKKDLIEVGFKEDKIKIIPVGMSFEPWNKESMYLKEDNPTFVYVGRYAFYKGIDIAIEAIGKLKKKHKNIHLWIIGKKDELYIKNKLYPISYKYGLSWSDDDRAADIVSWGFVSEDKKLELLSRATALVFPSIREGWGIPITEAALVGTPSVVFDAPGIRDAVKEGDAGYLCKKNDVDGLIKMLDIVIEDKEKYKEYVEKAYDFSRNFQWENNKNELEEFIEIICQNR